MLSQVDHHHSQPTHASTASVTTDADEDTGDGVD